MASAKSKSHPINQSCLYRVVDPKILAKLLFKSESSLEELADTSRRYMTWQEDKKSGGKRTIEAPHENLKIVQKRIAEFLQRISPPDYLMAPVKGRSYVSNAAKHLGSRSFCLLDIEDFFPSCTDKKVYWFFHKLMQCSPHVATLLTKITTHNGHLPQGSPCSPILAYFAYKEMWDEVHAVAVAADCKLSIYADDITISGAVVYGKDIWAIKRTLRKHGHKYSLSKERHIVDKPADITGVIVCHDQLLLPNRQHEKMAQAALEVRNAKTGRERAFAIRKFKGRQAQAQQILNHET